MSEIVSKYYVSDDGDIILGSNPVSIVHPGVKNLTDEIVADAVSLKKSEFLSKYGKLAEKSYHSIRELIVDEKIPIPKKVERLSRKDQIEKLYNEGMTSPSKIAKEIGSHPSYVSGILKKIKK